MAAQILSAKQKMLAIIIGLVLGVCAIYLIYHYKVNPDYQKQAERYESIQKKFHKKADSLNETPNSDLNENNNSSQSSVQTVEYSQKDANESADWMRRVGRFSDAEMASYQGYDDDALESLGNQGDIKALQILGDRFFKKDKNKANKYYELAAIHGSISAILTMTIPGFYQNTKDPLSEQAMVNSLALCEVMNIRGDTFNGYTEAKSLLARYKRITEKDFHVSQELISEKAKEIYERWRSKRLEMNLGEFDNTIPEGLQRVYGELKKN